jgi:hypothetical protein
LASNSTKESAAFPRFIKAVGRLWAAAVIYNSADSFISPRVRARESAPHPEILRENKHFAPRGAAAEGHKTGRFMPDWPHFMPDSAPFDKSSRSAFSPAGRGFGRFLVIGRFIISRTV